MKLNLGCSDRKLDGYIGVDLVPPADQIVNLAKPWPWDTSSVEEVKALDVIEHIGDCDHVSSFCSRCVSFHHKMQKAMLAGSTVSKLIPSVLDYNQRHPLGRVHFMNELHRVLIPGGLVLIETPNAGRGGVGFFQDPTHISPFCLSTFKYFEFGSFAHQRLSKSYGITAAFEVLSLVEIRSNGEDPREEVWKIQAHLRAVK